jgi:hypothetical protein
MNAIPLGALIKIVRKTISSAYGDGIRCVALDTSDAREGIINLRKPIIVARELGSAKKVAQPGDILISRLRPYLRQIAFIDNGVEGHPEAVIACSTEFYVLRSTDHQSIAFLLPFLLSDQVQKVLAAAQEGGHHPRFREDVLLNLPVDARIIHDRDLLSQAVKQSIDLSRQSQLMMLDAISQIEVLSRT